ncbi:MAG: helix-turn-helix domain-containing protein [Chloroflexota bacterium]|nr:helix-turn-helix domain-containing protein [Chloroflexota bacterium]
MQTATPGHDRATATLGEVAALLGIGRSTAYELAQRDALPVPVIRLGRRLVVPRAALDRLLAGDSMDTPSGDDRTAA